MSPRRPLAIALLALALCAPRSVSAVRSEEIAFASGDLKLAGTVLLPDGAGPFPGAVLVHGSGASDRSNPWTSAWTDALVARGIAVLHPDKRGAGASEGDWREASLLDLAGDAAAGAAALRAHAGVDASNVGLIGFSQGGHVVPAAAARDPAVAFAASVSGSVVPILEQVEDEVLMAAEREGLGEEDVARVSRIQDAAARFALAGTGWDAYEAALQDARDAGLAGRDVVQRFPTDPEDPVWSHVRRLGRFDPMEHWRRLTVPVLFTYGGRDERVRVPKSVARIQSELGSTGANYTLLLLGPNGHAHVRDDQLDLVARWIRDRGAR